MEVAQRLAACLPQLPPEGATVRVTMMFTMLPGALQAEHTINGVAMNDPKQQIVDQLAEIAWILDHKEWDRLGEVFTEDAEGYGQQGLRAITANTIRYLGRCGPTQHLTGNHRIRLDGDRATSTSYIRAIHFSAPDRPVQQWDFVGTYYDTWLHTDAGWQITRRRCRPRGTLGDLVLPVEDDG